MAAVPKKQHGAGSHQQPSAISTARSCMLLSIVLGCWTISVNGSMEEMMIAPIEVIEEWGCQDTEVRLTCGNLESKIAILEAKFTPRCRPGRTGGCVHLNEYSITHPYAAQKVDKLILEETEAGRRFLATMRRNHEKELEEAAAAAAPPGSPLVAGAPAAAAATSRYDGHGSTGGLVAARSIKDKRSSLRATLEHLMVRYLRRLTSGDDEEQDGDEPGGYEAHARYRRQLPSASGEPSAVSAAATTGSSPQPSETDGFSNSMEITLLTNDTDTNLTVDAWRQVVAPASDLTLPTGGAGDGEEMQEVDERYGGYTGSGSTVSGADGNGLPSDGEGFVLGRGDNGGRGGGGGGGEIVSAVGDDDTEHNQSDADAVLERVGDSVDDAGGGGDRSSSPLRQAGSPGRARGPRDCTSVRKRVSQLDRFELERSMRNGSFREYNIRDALNYRCSGKNHCSFIFAQDHPFAVVWKEGTVRIKYICMDDYRVSKYCGEHLIVRNEIRWGPLDDDYDSSETDTNDAISEVPPTPEPLQRTGPSMLNTLAPPRTNYDASEPQQAAAISVEESVVRDSIAHGFSSTDGHQRDRRLTREDEPRAEALHAATVHSFHNLKILKPIEEPSTVNDTDTSALELEAAHNRNRQRQKVFSQDFRVLKILPSNLDVVEDIKQIGNEYYFKKDVEVLVDDNENAIVDDPDGERERPAEAANRGQGVNYTATTSDGSEMTETLDIVVLPAPTKDIEIYENEVLPESESQSPDDLSVIGLITPTRLMTTSVYSSSMATVSVELAANPVTDSPPTVPSSASSITVDTTLGHWDEDRLVLPELEESGELSSQGQGKPNRTTDEQDKFRFDNGTFRRIQETVRKELDESWNPIPPPDNYDEDDDDDEEEDDYESHPFGKGSRGFHKKYTSVQRTLLKRPLRQGFLMTPGYPKYYIGDSVCQWTLYAGQHQRIKLTVLDLALRHDDECRDYLHVVDLNTNHTLFHSCTESTRPIEIVSIQDRLEVSVRTTTKVIYPKRGVLLHYTALGCEAPSPTPGRMKLVRRTENKAKYVCDPLHVFPDTGETSRELICTAKHAWNRALPPCVEKRTTEGSGLVSHYEQKRRYGEIDRMSDNQADTVYDILIPSFVIAALFIVNGIVFAVIMRYRNKRKQRLDLESKELAEL
ncbi:uncharacterized protein LOC126569023 [Anopheles aquasalis]|uniref:uncharacterized protein LOC126569023 n=1 Tax=Anopheles aquasalis TaxID=42839 RepID=UPI00215B4404|nr:uncharacterized protein LOC126569023 [Anopheles aquasalis]XP_050081762.1 uncharacterized protein LOC126569023 [Anopheles aquasalis]